MRSRSLRGLLPFLALFALLFTGCGSSFDPSDIVIGDPHTPSPPTATVRLQSVLAQTVVPDGVNVFRASGFDASDNRLYGPETQPAGPVVDFTGVPVDVTVFLVEYLEGSRSWGSLASPWT